MWGMIPPLDIIWFQIVLVIIGLLFCWAAKVHKKPEVRVWTVFVIVCLMTTSFTVQFVFDYIPTWLFLVESGIWIIMAFTEFDLYKEEEDLNGIE